MCSRQTWGGSGVNNPQEFPGDLYFPRKGLDSVKQSQVYIHVGLLSEVPFTGGKNCFDLQEQKVSLGSWLSLCVFHSHNWPHCFS